VDETLLFLHVLAAFAMVSGIVMLSALALGAPIGSAATAVGNRLMEIGTTLVLIFGVWIVLREEVYDVTDGWILGAIGLWLVTAAVGSMGGERGAEGAEGYDGGARAMHWAAVAATLGILVLMVWKPGA
jgi:hypothetical protein